MSALCSATCCLTWSKACSSAAQVRPAAGASNASQRRRVYLSFCATGETDTLAVLASILESVLLTRDLDHTAAR